VATGEQAAARRSRVRARSHGFHIAFTRPGSPAPVLCASIAFSLVVIGATRSADLRREGHALAAGVFVGIGVLAFAAVIAGIVFGITILTRPDRPGAQRTEAPQPSHSNTQTRYRAR